MGRGHRSPVALPLVAVAFAGLALTAPLHNVWLAVLPLNALMGIGMGFVVSRLDGGDDSASDADSGIASGVNNAVARVAGCWRWR